jgi:hypothetical protein
MTQSLPDIPSCALDEEGLRGQRERQARLAASVARTERDGMTIAIYFRHDFDRSALDEMLAVERRCCPFFAFGFDEQERRLEVSVQEAGHAPALEAIAAGLGAAAARV